MKRMSFTKFFAAVLLVGLGILLLLVNTNIISLEINTAIVRYYPIIVIILGLWLLIEPMLSNRRIHWFWGFFFLILGSLLMADRFNIVTFHLSMVWKLWPLLLIYIGIKALTKGSGRHRYKDKSKRMKDSSVFHVVSDITMDEPNWLVESMDYRNMVGDYDFDFSQAFIPDQDTHLNFTGWVGDIKFLIPEDVAFSIEGHASVGDITIGGYKQDGLGKAINYKTADYDTATRKLTFHLDYKVLDLRIDRV